MKMTNGAEIISLLESFSPKSYAMDGDPVGLQIGRLNKSVSKVMIALDVLEEVVDEAIEKGVQLIIAHHPLIYRPLKKIATDVPGGRIIEKLIKHDIAVYAAHTNLDVARNGVNDFLAEALELQDTEVLIPTYQPTYKKLVVYVPGDSEQLVRQALGNAGAGHIGNYSHCSFSSEGVGRFLPGENSNPAIGTQGRLESVEEVRIETIFPEEIEKKLLAAMIKAHPYEEPAYDIYRLENKPEPLGLGRIGTLKQEMTLDQFAGHVKDALDVKAVRAVGNLNSRIKKVAVLGGDGNKYFTEAKFKGADVYVTGDMYYHTAHDAMMMGLNIVDPGHNVEKVMKKGVADVLAVLCRDRKFEVEFIISEINTDPFTFI
ncbi:Nif3-like dinuclear metal center hexameric protein [Peribacillus cavernae]|uniref:GTP cyclohydrolase 1 type 2 homolog n=1 Tax=Peribacillus cavernae TaxID=1674310 RepID=A0A3S0UCK7_9BACI|nr:Nif3-like dinuclear metal center hexameric protein [Peribacillus cavernae]MDQ0218281.1 dinuclear metal center YbgI/SA1388 family protein [Peribacillus cavernae]RUQ28434.1 Nif3-like dinuclear metal center hexameric protein [Peribacillus cavernae]